MNKATLTSSTIIGISALPGIVSAGIISIDVSTTGSYEERSLTGDGRNVIRFYDSTSIRCDPLPVASNYTDGQTVQVGCSSSDRHYLNAYGGLSFTNSFLDVNEKVDEFDVFTSVGNILSEDYTFSRTYEKYTSSKFGSGWSSRTETPRVSAGIREQELFEGGIVGIRLTDFDTNEFMYGWLDIEFSNEDSTLSILGGAYNDNAGEDILSGTLRTTAPQNQDIPAPSTIALLATGLGMLAMNRRRKLIAA